MKEFEFKNTLVSKFKIKSIKAMLTEAYTTFSSQLLLKVCMSTMEELEDKYPQAHFLNFLLEE